MVNMNSRFPTFLKKWLKMILLLLILSKLLKMGIYGGNLPLNQEEHVMRLLERQQLDKKLLLSVALKVLDFFYYNLCIGVTVKSS